jgi:hypothetical protein
MAQFALFYELANENVHLQNYCESSSATMCIVYGLRLDVHHVCVIIERENNRVTSKCEQSVDLRNELRLKELRPGLTFKFYGCGPLSLSFRVHFTV